MHITSSAIIDDYIDNRFGKHGEEKLEGVPTRSIPLAWSNLPAGTISLALIVHDHDAIPVCGFSWIHWVVANIDPSIGELAENASRENTSLTQGRNSLASKQICGDLPDSLTCFYGGPRPPDQDHEYEFALYALDTRLDVSQGFRLNELLKKMRGHILDSATLYGIYPHLEN